MLTLLMPLLSLCISPVNGKGTSTYQILVAADGKRGDTCSGKSTCQRLFAEYSSHGGLTGFPELPFFVKYRVRGSGYASCQRYDKITDVQTYFPPINLLRKTDGRRKVACVLLLETSGEPVSERDQKKSRERPDSEKQKSGKPGEKEAEKPKREGDKGLQRVKRPKKRIGMPPPPPKEQGFSGLVVALWWLC